MSRARRAEAARARPYQAQIPITLSARLRNTNTSPLIDGILVRQGERRQALEDATEQLLEGQRSQIAQRRQDAASSASNRAAISQHPGTSEQRVRQQWALVWEFYRSAQLVSDRLERAGYARQMQSLLLRNELILQELARSPSHGLPRISDLRGVIVRESTARAALGAAATASLERETPDGWSEQPWFFERRAWDANYLRQQQILRERQRAQAKTRITIPRPFLATGQQIPRVVDHVLCLILS